MGTFEDMLKKSQTSCCSAILGIDNRSCKYKTCSIMQFSLWKVILGIICGAILADIYQAVYSVDEQTHPLY